MKDDGGDQLVDAGRVVASEEAVIAPSATQRLIAEFAKRPVSPEVEGWASYRARIGGSGAGGGRTRNAEIAEELYVSETTVKTLSHAYSPSSSRATGCRPWSPNKSRVWSPPGRDREDRMIGRNGDELLF